MNPFETTPLFHYNATSSAHQLYGPHYAGQAPPPPPPYQFAQLYPTHVSPQVRGTFTPLRGARGSCEGDS